ncbi:MAG: dihydrolipoyl dehydrogenase family protein [Acidobacteriota bacterium]|jgi:glutathione reductase (NADPH)
MNKTFDLIAIGTGSAASAVVSRCSSAGWQVAIVDSRPFGGTCALRGCDPKKVLVGAAELTDWARRMQDKGVHAGQLKIDWRELMHFKRSFTDPVPKHREEGFRKAGIAAFHGRAHFASPTSIRIGDDMLEARSIVVAAGQKPVDLKIPGVDHLITSEQFLELEDLPPRILFIGGGYIAFEFAHVALRAGSQVTIVHRCTRPLPQFDPDMVDLLVQHTRALGADLHLETEAIGIEKESEGLAVRTSASGKIRIFHADLVVHAAGRQPEIDDMNLDAAGITWDQHGVKVNEYLQSVSNPAVYAAGDAAASQGPPLTPVASYEGALVAANLLKGNHARPDYRGIPSAVFTIPPLASVGLREEEAREKGLKFKVKMESTATWYSSRRIAESSSGYKTLVEEGTDRILGAHLFGSGATEVINLFALAIRSGIRAQDMKHMIFSYPTHGSDLPYML